MFIGTENETDPDKRIQNNNLQYKTQPNHQFTLPNLYLFEHPYFSKKKNNFIEIRVFRLFSWPAFCGPKILVYINICIYN